MFKQRFLLNFVLVPFAISIAAGASAQATQWREKYYNPQPAMDDLVLPMPCGGAMVFRKVATPNTDGVVGDVPVTLGQEGGAQPYLNGLWRSYVSGAFAEADGTAKGYFYIAKYELAQAQYDVVMGENCPQKPPRRRAFVPSVNQTKLDYDRFAETYTLWLMQNAPDMLLRVGDTRSYLRLPTEEEWEYSARGGLAVEQAVFRAPLPEPADNGSLDEYIAHGGSSSAGGKLQVIGTLKANSLGIHDMLGNAAEIVGTPFALVRHGRLHGQAGGYVKRGGDARTPISRISLATRFEVPPFDVISNSTSSDKFAGTRLVLQGLSISSEDHDQALIEGLQKLARPDPGLSVAASEAEAIDLLDSISNEMVSERNRSRLAVIKDTLFRGRAERNAQRDRSVRLILTSAVLVCDQGVQRYINALISTLTIQHDLDELETEARNSGDNAFLKDVLDAKDEAQAKLRELENKAKADVTEYANLIEGLAEQFSLDLLHEQSAFIQPEIEARGVRRKSCMQLLERHIETRINAGFSDLERIGTEFQDVALAQVEK